MQGSETENAGGRFEHLEEDVPVTRFLGMTIDNKLTIANVIQIAILFFTVFVGGYKLVSTLGDVMEKQDNFKEEFREYVKAQDVRLDRMAERYDNLYDSFSESKIDAAVNKQRVDTLSSAIEKLTQAIERMNTSTPKGVN